MTRANLNFVSHEAILFHYHNGDQYPDGLVDYFGIRELCAIDRLWTPDDFKAWIRNNYTEATRRITNFANGMSIDAHAQTDVPAETEAVEQPCIYYTGSFITDYSYVFTHSFQTGRKRKDGSRQLKDVNYRPVSTQGWSFYYPRHDNHSSALHAAQIDCQCCTSFPMARDIARQALRLAPGRARRLIINGLNSCWLRCVFAAVEVRFDEDRHDECHENSEKHQDKRAV
jgi:hypothetical protein